MSPRIFFEAQLKELVHDCLYGQLHYRTWKRLNESFGKDTDTMDVAPLFFVSSAEAHLNSVRLHIFRLLDDAGGATSIYELVKYAEENKNIFKNEVKLINAIQRHRKQLTRLNPTIKNLLKHRKKHFIHKSKEYLNKGYDNLYKDYKEILQAISEILNDYLELLKSETMEFSFLGEDSDFEDLKYYLRKGIDTVEKANRNL